MKKSSCTHKPVSLVDPQKRKPVVILTNTNSDTLCCPNESSWISRKLYQLSLHNGLYMLNRREQLALQFLAWSFFVLSMVYCYVFLQGFFQGCVSVSSLSSLQQQQQPAMLLSSVQQQEQFKLQETTALLLEKQQQQQDNETIAQQQRQDSDDRLDRDRDDTVHIDHDSQPLQSEQTEQHKPSQLYDQQQETITELVTEAKATEGEAETGESTATTAKEEL